MKRKFLVSADMEGIAGTVSWKEYESDYQRYRRMFTAEVRAVCEGILAAEPAAEIIVCDAHGSGENLVIEKLPEKVLLSRGNGRPLLMMDGIDRSCALAFFVGYHSAAGTVGSPMDHTYSSRTFFSIRVNGREVDEAMLNAALAGYFGVPIGLISGDDKLIRQARREFPDIETVVTKTGRSRLAAVVRHPAAVLRELKSKAERATRKLDTLRPYYIRGQRSPVLEMVFTDTIRTDLVMLIPGCRRLDGRTVRYQARDFLNLYQVLRLAAILGGAGGAYL